MAERTCEKCGCCRCVGKIAGLIGGKDQSSSFRIEPAGQHSPRFARFAAEDWRRVQRGDDDICINETWPLRLQRRQRLLEPLLVAGKRVDRSWRLFRLRLRDTSRRSEAEGRQVPGATLGASCGFGGIPYGRPGRSCISLIFSTEA